MKYLDFLPLASFLFCAFLSLFVFLRRRFILPASAFWLAMGSFSLIYLANFIALNTQVHEKVLLWIKVSLAGEAVFSGSCLLFSFTFGKTNFRNLLKKWSWVLLPAYLITAFLFISLLATPQALTIVPAQPQIVILNGVAKYSQLLLFLIIIFAIVNLESTFRASAGLERWRIKYFFFAFTAILVCYVYTFSQRVLYGALDLNNVYFLSVITITSDALLFYSIIKTGVVDREIFVSRRVIYTSISLVAIGLYSIVVGIVIQLLKSFHFSTYFRLDILFIFFASLVILTIYYKESVRRKIKSTINRHFNKSKYVYRDEWLVFSTELSKFVDYKRLCDNFLKILSERLFVNKVSLWLADDNQNYFTLISSRNIDVADTQCALNGRFIEALYQNNKPLNKVELLGGKSLDHIRKEISLLFDNTEADLLVPLKLGKNHIGFLTLGKIQTGEAYIEEDYKLLQSVAAHAASAIHTARLFDEQLVSRELKTFHRLSSFIMHDLKNAASMLSMVVQNAKKHLCDPEFQKEALETISKAVARMEKMIINLSALPNELVLQKQDIDLNELIKQTIDGFSSNGFHEMSIEKRLGEVPLVRADAEEIRKVIYNLILNAGEALNGAGLITVATLVSDDRVVVNVSDTGPGMSAEFIEKSLFKPFKSTKQRGLGIGMYQCKTIIEAHGGRIEVQSKLGEGTTFSVYLPIGS